VSEATRVNPAAIADFLAREAWWKFVVAEPGDVDEVLGLLARFALPRERVLLMPEGIPARRDPGALGLGRRGVPPTRLALLPSPARDAVGARRGV